MQYEFVPAGVCSKKIYADIQEDGTIRSIAFIGGCEGNLTGIGELAKGRKAVEVIGLLEGIDCGGRGTSCPDQLAAMLRKIVGRPAPEKSLSALTRA